MRKFVAVVAVLLALTAVGAAQANQTEEAGHAEEETSTLHLGIEITQIILSVIALAGVGLAMRTFKGGRIAGAIAVTGAGVALFAIERLWHNIHELGFVPAPGLASQAIFLVSTGLFAYGYFKISRTM